MCLFRYVATALSYPCPLKHIGFPPKRPRRLSIRPGATGPRDNIARGKCSFLVCVPGVEAFSELVYSALQTHSECFFGGGSCHSQLDAVNQLRPQGRPLASLQYTHSLHPVKPIIFL